MGSVNWWIEVESNRDEEVQIDRVAGKCETGRTPSCSCRALKWSISGRWSLRSFSRAEGGSLSCELKYAKHVGESAGGVHGPLDVSD